MTKTKAPRRALCLLLCALLLLFLALSFARIASPTGGMRFAFRPLPFVLLLLSLIPLLIFRRRIPFVCELYDLVTDELRILRSLQFAKRALHILCVFTIFLYFLAAFADLALSVTHPVSAYLLWALALLAVTALLLDTTVVRRDASFAWTFFLVFMIVGSTFALTIPPTMLVSWDDEYHFKCMVYPAALANGRLPLSLEHLATVRPPFRDFLAGTEGFVNTLLGMDGATHPLPALPIPSLHPLAWVALLPLAPFAALYALYRYLVYLPGILVCSLALLCRADAILVLTLCRLSVLTVTAAVYTLAIRRLVYGRHLFAFCALLPTAVFLAVNPSADPFINAFIALGFAYFIGELQRKDEPMTWKNAVIMLSALALGCAPKAIYFFLFLPLLFLPACKSGTKKGAWLFRLAVLLTAAVVAFTILIPILINAGAYTDNRGGTDVSASGQVVYVLTHPFAYLRTFLHYLRAEFNLSYITDYVTFFAYFGGGDRILGSLYLALLFFLAVADRSRKETFDLSTRPLPRLTSLLSACGAVLLVVTSLYVSYTPVGAAAVAGCQFRYFFPLFPIVLYFLGSIRLRSFVSERALTLLSLGGGALFNLAMIYQRVIAPLG